MKVLKIILLILVVVIGGALIWLSTLDGKFNVERSATIDASPDEVYAAVSNLATWPAWGVWFEREPDMVTDYNEQTQGLGAWYTWYGKDGKGRLEIVEVDPGKMMTTKIDFDGMGSSQGNWTFEPDGNGTKVTWGMSGEMPFSMRWMVSSMEKYVGPDFEEGLENLGEYMVTVKENKATAGYEFTEMNMRATDVYYQHHELPMDELSSELWANSYGSIGAYLGEDANNMTGMPMAIYHDWNEEEGTTVFDLALPCASEKPGNDNVMKGKSYEGTVLKATYYGSYEDMMPLYEAADAYITTNGYEQNGPVTEVYVTDPMTQPDTAQWATEVYWAVMKK